jgi:hypothetical protein
MHTLRVKPAFWLLLASLWLGAQIAPVIAADGDQYLGTWSGTWRGDDSSGHFQLTLERGSEGKVTGSIAVSQDGAAGGDSDYTAKLKSAGFVGDKFAATYEPPDGQSEISFKGTFSPNGADGNWSLGAKNQPASPAVTAGTWKITKK